MAERIEGEIEHELLEEQQRLRNEVQRLRDEQQRLRDEQQKARDSAKEGEKKPEGNVAAAPAKEEPKAPAKKKGLSPVALVIIAIVLIALAIGGFFLWGYLSSYESTDDAQVDGHIDSMSSRISGTVTAVHVDDNQQVQAGQLLVELDPRDYQVALEQSQAA